MKILETLQSIGFSDKEAKVYVELVRLGTQSASVIAKAAGINRTSTYDLLEALKERGVVQSIKKRSTTLFQALSPKELVHFLEREKTESIRKIEKQKAQIAEILPELTALENPYTHRPKVTFYEGANGLREAYEDTLNSTETILAYANVEEMHKGLPNFFPEYYHRRAVEKKIAIKAIMPDNAASKDRAKKDKLEKRKSVFVPKEDYDFSPEVNIYNNKVLIASWREKLAIIIESKEIADFHRKIYKLAWERAETFCPGKDSD